MTTTHQIRKKTISLAGVPSSLAKVSTVLSNGCEIYINYILLHTLLSRNFL